MRYRDVCLEALGCELPPFVASTESIFERITPTLERLKIPVESVVGASGVEEIRFGPKTPPSPIPRPGRPLAYCIPL